MPPPYLHPLINIDMQGQILEHAECTSSVALKKKSLSQLVPPPCGLLASLPDPSHFLPPQSPTTHRIAACTASLLAPICLHEGWVQALDCHVSTVPLAQVHLPAVRAAIRSKSALASAVTGPVQCPKCFRQHRNTCECCEQCLLPTPNAMHDQS